jgi:hypothetical protein
MSENPLFVNRLFRRHLASNNQRLNNPKHPLFPEDSR